MLTLASRESEQKCDDGGCRNGAGSAPDDSRTAVSLSASARAESPRSGETVRPTPRSLGRRGREQAYWIGGYLVVDIQMHTGTNGRGQEAIAQRPATRSLTG